MKWLVGLIIGICLVLSPIIAQTVSECIDNETVAFNKSFTFYENGSLSEYWIYEEIDCPYGCNETLSKEAICNQSPTMNWFTLMIIILGLIFFIWALNKLIRSMI